MLNNEPKNNFDYREFELVLVERDKKGNPTGKKIYKKFKSGYEMWEFFNKHQPNKKKKSKNRVDASKLPNRSKAEKLLKKANNL